jgi:aspartate-semialdehyde dehydrogenase
MAASKTLPRVAIVGATGMVGAELLHQLESRRFPVGALLPFSSGAAKKSVRFRGRSLPAPGVDRKALTGCDLAFFVSADEVSEALAPRLAAQGVWVIDDSAAFRLDPNVPLVIPEVNAHTLSLGKRLIAGPNCTMTGLAVAGYPLHKRFGAVAARVASYQAVSGAGRAALEEFFTQTRHAASKFKLHNGRAPVLAAPQHHALPGPIAGNVLPQVGGFDALGSTSEENKVAAELKKIWGAPKLAVSVTAVRVPVVRGHSLAAWLSLRRHATPAQAKALLSRAPGVKLSVDGRYPTPLSCAGEAPVYAGRLRRGTGANELCLWIVSDNLLKGAALNSIQIAEELLRRGWLKRRCEG